MASFKRGRFSAEEKDIIAKSIGAGVTVESLSKTLNRSVDSINKVVSGPKEEKVDNSQTYKVEPLPNIPDAPADLPKGYAKKFFEIEDSKNPGSKRKGVAILTEAGSEAGDDFNKARNDGLLPMSSKHRSCIAKAQG